MPGRSGGDFCRSLWPIAAALLAVSLAPPGARAQQADDDEPFLPGLVATYQDAGGHKATRVEHQLAHHWSEGPPDARLAGTEFRATWEGHLNVQARGAYRFVLFGTGEVGLKVAGREVVAKQVLKNGWQEA